MLFSLLEDRTRELVSDRVWWESEEAFRLALREVALEIHGSEKTLEAAFKDVTGAVFGDVGGAAIGFVARVEMPGRLLRTNGWIEESARAARIYWTFETNDIATTGHILEAESWAPRPEALEGIPGRKAALEVPDALAVIAALAAMDDEGRKKLSDAFASLRAERPPSIEAVERGLPEKDGLRQAFATLVKIATK